MKDARAVSSKAAESKAAGRAPGTGPLDDAERRAFKATLWRERFYSLWSPVTILGAALSLYIVLVELHTPAHLWAQPLMKGVALLCLVAFLGLALARWLVRPFGRLRHARHHAHEVLNELRHALQNPAVAKERREEGQQHEATLMRQYLTPDAQALEQRADAVAKFSEKDLGRKKFGADFLLGFVKAFAIAMAIRTVVIEPFKIPSGSMIPTLEIGDQIFVNKFIYGVRIPYANLVPFQIVRAPERGDVIVFNNPVDPDRDYIKRIVGVGGDRISIRGDVISINGTPQPRTLVDPGYLYMDKPEDGGWRAKNALLFQENLAGQLHSALQLTPRGPDYADGAEFVVPEGHVFVMGDNRNNSSDSRYGMGMGSGDDHLVFVPKGNIKGKAMVIWLSLSHRGWFHPFFGGTGFRTDRLFRPVR